MALNRDVERIVKRHLHHVLGGVGEYMYFRRHITCLWVFGDFGSEIVPVAPRYNALDDRRTDIYWR